MSKFGDRIRVLRIKRGYSQAEMADVFTKTTGVDLKRSALGNYERGIREPDFDTVEAFADFFDVSISDLMGREEDVIPKDTAQPPRDEINMSPAKLDRWIMLSNAFNERSTPEFEMWFNAIRANHPEFFNERTDDDDPES